MSDLLMLILLAACFTASLAYIRACSAVTEQAALLANETREDKKR